MPREANEVNTNPVNTRAVMIPGLESAPESDFGSIWTSDFDNSGSSSFSLESLESAPVGNLSVSVRFVLTKWANGSFLLDYMGQWELLI